MRVGQIFRTYFCICFLTKSACRTCRVFCFDYKRSKGKAHWLHSLRRNGKKPWIIRIHKFYFCDFLLFFDLHPYDVMKISIALMAVSFNINISFIILFISFCDNNSFSIFCFNSCLVVRWLKHFTVCWEKISVPLLGIAWLCVNQ